MSFRGMHAKPKASKYDKMTKAQLVAALKKAYKRIAKLEAANAPQEYKLETGAIRFPWQQVLNDTKGL